MTGFFVFIILIVGIGFGLRALRQREIDAFLDSDMSEFRPAKVPLRDDSHELALNAKAHAYLERNPEVVGTPLLAQHEPRQQIVPDPTLFLLKPLPFDEVTRNFFVLLHDVVPVRFIVQMQVSLSEFVRSENRNSNFKLGNTRIRFLICESDTRVVCGITLRDAGASGAQASNYLKGIFGDIGIPLLEFPVTNSISPAEIKEQLDPLLIRDDAPDCPKCGNTMTIRQAVKGKNTGGVFWVCSRFPACRGVTRIQ